MIKRRKKSKDIYNLLIGEYISIVLNVIETESIQTEETDTTKDRITAIGTAVELGVIFPSEARKEILEHLKITPIEPWWMLPTLEDNPAKEEAQQRADQQAEQSVVASQGVSGGISAQGGAQTSNNAARDNRKQDSNNA